MLENISCRCPPPPTASIPSHNTRQGIPVEHTEGTRTLRSWPESVFPELSEMHRPRAESLGGKFSFFYSSE